MKVQESNSARNSEKYNILTICFYGDFWIAVIGGCLSIEAPESCSLERIESSQTPEHKPQACEVQ